MNVFIAGVLATLLLSRLPSPSVIVVFGLLALQLCCLSWWMRFARPQYRRSITVLVVSAVWLAGFIYGCGWGHWRLGRVIATQYEQQDVRLIGSVSGLPQCRESRDQPSCSFVLDVTRASFASDELPLHQVALTAYGITAIDAGTCVDVVTRLKRPHGMFNPGSIDFEAARLRDGIDAVGYVRDSHALTAALKADSCAGPASRASAMLARTRALLRQQLLGAMGADNAMSGLLLALVLGDYSLVGRDQWALFNATGTQHLVTVSGFHIGMAALWGNGVGLLMMLGWRGGGQTRTTVAALCALLFATAYSLLAGMSVPTLRSLLMIAFYVGARLRRRESGIESALRAAFCAIVLINPLSATAVGFWLSFGAVAVLVVGIRWRRRRQSRVHDLLYPQWVVFVGLAPLLLALFGRLPLVSPLANVLAVPWTSFAVMPSIAVCLLGGGRTALFNDAASVSLEYLCLWLMWCRDLPLPWLSLSLQSAPVAVLAAALFSLFALAPAGLGVRRLALLLAPALLFASVTPASRAGMSMSVFDVGQGLAVLLESEGHHLLFDTGAAFGDGMSAAQIALLPYFSAQDIRALDLLVVSHADNDHAGGVPSVADAVAISQTIVGEAVPGARDASLCSAGQHWMLGAARIDVLYPLAPPALRSAGKLQSTAMLPSAGKLRLGNNASCVVLVSYHGRRLLLTGDIEAQAERQLLASGTLPDHIDVLVAPHHGSRTSSTAAFVQTLRPTHVVFSCGYRNRYRHPNPLVVQRYRTSGSTLYRSDEDGLIRFDIDGGGALFATRWRQRFRHYWMVDG